MQVSCMSHEYRYVEGVSQSAKSRTTDPRSAPPAAASDTTIRIESSCLSERGAQGWMEWNGIGMDRRSIDRSVDPGLLVRDLADSLTTD
jgi:hypothetical protein